MSAETMTFEIPGRVVFEMELKRAPFPSGVTTLHNLGATMIISCTEEQALTVGYVSQRGKITAIVTPASC